MTPTFIKKVISVKMTAANMIQQIFSFEKYFFSILYTFSFTCFPNSPAGLMIRIRIKMT